MNVKPVVQKPYIIIKSETPNGLQRKKVFPEVIVSYKDYKKHLTNYSILCENKPVGFLSLIDRRNGVWVDYMENHMPRRYSGVGAIADQIEVEHCLKRGLSDFKILSEATPFSLPFHYKRGKRFGTIGDAQDKAFLKEKYGILNLNIIMEELLKKFKVNKIHEEIDLVNIPMYMPKDLINKYLLVIQKYPLLKKLI